MADAAHIILTSNGKKTNDKFFMDDEVLAGVGIYDLQKYKVNPNVKDHELIIDFMC
jgi:citronellol/citronellal dehydrogenase